MSKFLPKRVEMEFEGGLSEAITAHAGVSLLIELGRISQVMGAAERCLPAKKSPKGLGQGQFVESFVLLSALAGDCLDDFDTLRQDQGPDRVGAGLSVAGSIDGPTMARPVPRGRVA